MSSSDQLHINHWDNFFDDELHQQLYPTWWDAGTANHWRHRRFMEPLIDVLQTRDDAWLTVSFEKGKHFTGGELRYDAKAKQFTLTLTTDKIEQAYTGTLGEGKQKEPILTLERADGNTVSQFTVTLLHGNRHLYQMSSRPKAVESFTRLYLVGATKEGEPFAEVAKGNECVVSGGTGTMTVTHNGKTYYVCCSGCRDEFKADPEKYIKLAAEKKK